MAMEMGDMAAATDMDKTDTVTGRALGLLSRRNH